VTKPPVLYAAITNHGFGHATRTASLLAEIQRRCPDLVLLVVTPAPRWLLEAYLEGSFIHRQQRLDIGAIQSDSFTIDHAATLTALEELRSQQERLVRAEVDYLQQNQAQLVLGDVPPMAGYIAKAAGVPCWMASNFGWDLIYTEWGDPFAEIVDWVRTGFSHCDRLFRLPFHEPMSAFPHQEDVGLTGGSPRFAPELLRQKLGLTVAPERTVLLTFGGYGVHGIPYHNLSRYPDWQFITFDAQAPDAANLLKLDGQQFRPVDLMPVCGRLVGKPGYGTFAEACRVGIPVISLPRSGFAEAPFLIQGLQDHSEHLLLAPGEFEQSNWEFLERPLLPPRLGVSLPKDGNEAIAQAVVNALQTNY
jgi:hypothetical protein